MNKQQILNGICGLDRVFGDLCSEAENSNQNKNYFSAVACLFVIAEQITKYALSKNDGNFYEILLEGKKLGIFDEYEFNLLDNLRGIRNKLFHESHYSSGIELGGKYYPFDECDIKEIIYKSFSTSLFEMVFKILKK